MTELLDRLLRGRGAAGDQGEAIRHWRRVPRLNLLPHRSAAADRRRFTRAALVAIVLLEVVFLFVQSQGKSADVAATEEAKTRLQKVQRDLAAEQAAIGELQGKVDDARKRVAAASAGYEQIVTSQTNWYAGGSNLLGARIDGIEYTSIIAKPGGIINLEGVAADLGAISRFQGRLREVSQSLRLQNISFGSANSTLRFTATLKVVP